MALSKQTVRLAMSGLDQGVDPKLASGLLKLENVRQHRKSEFIKRHALHNLTSSFADKNLTTYKGRPVQFGNSGVYALNAAEDAMVKVDDAGFMDAEVTVLVSTDPLPEVLERHSKDASVVLLGFKVPEEGEAEGFQGYFEEILSGLPTTLLVCSAGEVDLLS